MTVKQLLTIVEYISEMDAKNKQKQNNKASAGSLSMSPKHEEKFRQAQERMMTRRGK